MDNGEAMKQLYIVRGLPGSGKTTLAHTITDGYVYEADQFFMVNNEYKFDPELLRAAHDDCQDRVRQAMIDGQSPIAVSNTFSQRWEMAPYQSLAREFDYQVTIVEVQTSLSDFALSMRNLHNCPADIIARQRARWERVS
jgi:predicted kinase